MSFIFYFSVWALASAIGIACALGAREKKGGGGGPVLKTTPEQKRDEQGERVRGILFDCYKEMKRHTPCLHYLTGCLSRPAISLKMGLFALEKTLEGLAGRYNTKPIETAINRLKSL